MENQFSDIIVNAATHYWGSPNSSLSKGEELRFGNHGSKSVNISKATWFDHEAKVGGGVIDLIQYFEPNAHIPEKLENFGLQHNKNIKNRETIWTYEDEFGNPKYQIIRLDKPSGKTYLQRHFTSDGKFEWGMAGVTALPYKLPLLKNSSDTIFVVEGEKAADSIIQLGLIATTNHGGANKWYENLSVHFQDRAVVIIPDNDEAGNRHAQRVASQLNRVALVVKILTLPQLPPKGDVFDWIAGGGTKEKLIELANAAPLYQGQDNLVSIQASETTPISSKKFYLTQWNDLTDIETPWLVEGLIPAVGLSALFGKPGSGKSFVALDLAASIGSGSQFFGKNVLEGDVIYIAGEGGAGLKSRRDALEKQKNIQSPKVHFLQSQLDLRSNEYDREALIAEIESRDIKPVLIIIDTLARAFAGGNENASDDMGKFIAQVTAIQQRLNTAVLIVHHSGKDEARGQRGHSSLNAAIDAEIEIQKLSELGDETRIGQMTVTKQKDGEDGLKLYFRLETVPLGIIGSARSSLVVQPIDESDIHKSGRRKPLKGHNKTAYEALKKAIDEYGEVRFLPNIPSDRRSITVSLWRQTFYSMIVSDGDKGSDSKQKAFKRASQFLVDIRTIGVWSDYVWIPDG